MALENPASRGCQNGTGAGQRRYQRRQLLKLCAGEFGYWVCRGRLGAAPAQRPSVELPQGRTTRHHRRMFCHWRYVLDHTFGPVRRVQAQGGTHIPAPSDEAGRRYRARPDDAAYGSFELCRPRRAIRSSPVEMNSSWAVRSTATRRCRSGRGTSGIANRGPARPARPAPVNTPGRVESAPTIPNPFQLLSLPRKSLGRRCPTTETFDNSFQVSVGAVLATSRSDTPFQALPARGRARGAASPSSACCRIGRTALASSTCRARRPSGDSRPSTCRPRFRSPGPIARSEGLSHARRAAQLARRRLSRSASRTRARMSSVSSARRRARPTTPARRDRLGRHPRYRLHLCRTDWRGRGDGTRAARMGARLAVFARN